MPGKVRDRDADRGQARFSTATRLRLLGEQTAERVYRSQNKRQARRSRLTGRAALLALVVCTLVVALAYPIRQYVSQRGEIADLQRQQQEAKERVDRLRDEKARWQDDSYAEQRIRERLHMVMPGETGYVMPDPKATASSSRTEQGAADRPWYANVWDGVDKADQADLAQN
ncbi:septum formation initiator family protein [Streptomyces sp. VRA16 Mangrove soil]|uniref:FtsB family cell division protein n=1 Tax=Streptomyces sp. VRA16 Mangrove soil TaxID=2817434 RepID=UPI001A9FE44A|nr:septum formation initiator family protein [Streptomyces sp. VRA16 Mangrove soil]MBO1336580.1 septum formation initiator family protein [Streptomyces sp. VRA16 Mangrove soil]